MLGRPLSKRSAAQVAVRGAYAIQRVSFTGSGFNLPWAQKAPEKLLDEPAPIEVHAFHEADGWIGIEAPGEHARALGALAGALRPRSRPRSARTSSGRSRSSSSGSAASTRPRRWRRTPACPSPSSRTSSSARACSTGRREGADEPLRRALRRGRRGADRRRRDRPHAEPRRPQGDGRRRRREHARRRVLLLAGRGLGLGDDRVHRVPGRLRRPRGDRHPAALRGRPRRRRLRGRGTRTS